MTHTATNGSLSAGASSTFEIRCAPTTTGIKIATSQLAFAHSAGVDVPLSVEVVAAPGRARLAANPVARIDFGVYPRGETRETWLLLRNGGSAPLTTSSFDVEGQTRGAGPAPPP